MTIEELKTFKELIADGLNSSRDIVIECAEGDLARAKLEAIRPLLEPGCDEVDIAKAREILAL